ncbi:pentatricopeptide repeat-containing protein, chloroplastic [Acrodontium crateriforme]|uniref:Pentatricopeptide repeat-containing protein, chloroplastic n=1 Tax=Acrodontium crateriforme TaxID=150365 RepID=A0AAQ3LYC2_9PEZI|nr:pentatricopeptide repeat-containing protein, chloroplastic [Acrodontium crateriforme]
MPLCSSLQRLGALNAALRLTGRPSRQHWIAQCCSRPTFYSTTVGRHHEDNASSTGRIASDYDAYLDLVFSEQEAASNQQSSNQTPRREPVKQPPSRSTSTFKTGGRNERTSQNGELYSGWKRSKPRSLALRKKSQQAAGRPNRLKVRWEAHVRSNGIRSRVTSLKTVQRPSANFSSSWNTNFSEISKQYDRLAGDDYQKPTQSLSLDPKAAEWAEILLQQMKGGVGTIHIESFARQYQKIGREVWSQATLWLLNNDKARVLDFLLATHTAPFYPPINFVEDCLQHLAEYCDHLNPSDAKDYSAKLINAFCILADRQNTERLQIRSSFVRLILPHSTHEQVSKLYGAAKVCQVKQHPYTLHHISAFFAKSGHLEQAIDALLEARAAGADMNSVAFRSNCSTLLRQSIQHPGGMRMCLRLINNLVKVGVTLTNQLCNIIMLNAVEARDFNTVFSVYHSLREQGLKPDAYTFGILLKACKVDIDNADALKNTIEDAIASGTVRDNVVVSTSILDCLAVHHAKHNPRTAYSTVINAYTELFDVAPLKQLGLDLPGPSSLLPPEPVEKPTAQLMQPSPHAINIVLAIYLQHGPANRDARQIYNNWRNLVKTGVEPLASLATTTYTSLVFLLNFIQSKSTLIHATRIVKDMQTMLPSAANVVQHPPDVQIWSVFLHGFTKHGQMKLAEQVLEYMRSKGIEPNEITWNTLLAGYAEEQDMDGLLGTLRRLDQSGIAYDRFTYSGLRRFRNKQKLKNVLAQAQFEKNMDFTADLKKSLQQRMHSVEGENNLIDHSAPVGLEDMGTTRMKSNLESKWARAFSIYGRVRLSASHNFLPPVPSPLSPRSINVYGRRSLGFMSSPDHKLTSDRNPPQTRARDDSSIPFAKRPVKKAPSTKQNELQERRRGLFLKKVRDGRDDKRFEARGEDMMRLDFVRQQRQWEAERARDAPWMAAYGPDEDENEEDLPTSSGAMQLSRLNSQTPLAEEEEEVEEVVQMEDQELEALLSFMPANGDEEMNDQELRSDHVWSDDDDYDDLFSEFMDQGNDEQVHVTQTKDYDDDMDMS